MRLLVTFVGGLGHLAPLLPLAHAVRDAGHVVAIAGSGGLVARIEEAGFTAFATSPESHHLQTPPSQGRRPLDVMDARSAELEFVENFGDRGARRMARAVPDIIRSFRPDLVLRDETDLGTTIAAELVGVPVACHLVLASGLLIRPELVAPRLDAVRAEHGLPADPDLTRLTSGLVLTDAAPSFRSPESPLPLELTHRAISSSDFWSGSRTWAWTSSPPSGWGLTRRTSGRSRPMYGWSDSWSKATSSQVSTSSSRTAARAV